MVSSTAGKLHNSSSVDLPLVSIIIPVYNGEKYLKELMMSLQKLSYRNIEIITVDNKSIDNSLELLHSLNAQIIPLKIVHNERNEGYCGGCNRGIENSRGEFLLFLSQDRLIESDWLNKIVERMLSDPKIGCVLGKVLRKGASTPEYGHSYDVYGAVLIKGTPEEIGRASCRERV